MVKFTKKPSPKTSVDEVKEIEELIRLTEQHFDASKQKLFADLPLSQKTKQGLMHANFMEMTDIQRASLGYSLCQRDVLGAAKTGSGKTLAFIIPILELLYRQKWTLMDGLGALIISPTRELALQIFGVLRKVGKYHSLSAGLAIGGKDLHYEQERITRMNILVCTPGRLLQHMDQTANFECTNLQMLVLDEADRILDLGFKKTMNAVLENLPRERQTLLFSATQTKSVGDLARLSLKDPEYVAVHEKADKSTPDTLQQSYLVCHLFQKLDVLYSFVKSHLKSKCLIFLSSCKQVRFVYECFCKMQPGTVVMCLHGKQKQSTRDVMFEKFCSAKHAIMICTDIAARGLDFPAVDWVIQADAPEDAATYIHRVGRTARFSANGKALMFLLPSEEKGVLEVLEKKKVPIAKIKVNPNKTQSIIPQLQSICAQFPDIKYLGEKAFICYLRSIWLQKNKDVFNLDQMPIDEFASSLGLPGTPRVKFVRKLKAQKNQPRVATKVAEESVKDVAKVDGQVSESGSEESEHDESAESQKKPHTRLEKMFNKKNQSMVWQHYDKIKDRDEDGKTSGFALEDDDEEGFIKLARKDHALDGVPTMAPNFLERPLSVRDKRYMKVKKRTEREGGLSTKINFDEEGNPHLAWKLETEGEFVNDDSIAAKHQRFVKAAKEVMDEADKEDKMVAKEKRREKRLKQKLKTKQGENPATVVQLDTAMASNDEDDVSAQEYSEQSDQSEDEEFESRAPKRSRVEPKDSMEAAEELALKLLARS